MTPDDVLDGLSAGLEQGARLDDMRPWFRRAVLEVSAVAQHTRPSAAPRDVFVTVAFPWVLEIEGRYSLDQEDKGNWTGGQVGVGELRGTKYGISAASFPHLAIGSLTVEQAREIYRSNYWDQVRGDNLPPVLALATFDGAVQHGPRTSAKQLQSALHVVGDGIIGNKTLDAARHSSPVAVLTRMFRQRAELYRKHPKAERFFDGWMDRLFRLQVACLRLGLSDHQGI